MTSTGSALDRLQRSDSGAAPLEIRRLKTNAGILDEIQIDEMLQIEAIQLAVATKLNMEMDRVRGALGFSCALTE